MIGAGDVKAVGQCPAGMVAVPAGDYKGKRIAALCVDQSEATNRRWDEVMKPGFDAVPLSCPFLAPMSPVGRYDTAQETYAAAQRKVDQTTVCGAGQMLAQTAEPRSPSRFDRPNQPRVMINAYQAEEFCAAQGKRLLTPDEWAYVASKGGTRKHSTRDGTLKKGVVSCRGSVRQGCPDATADVGSLAGNYVEWGGREVWDMNGNVWEWTYDPTEKYFALNGGSWYNYYPRGLVPDHGDMFSPDNHCDDVGVRCAASPRTP